MADRALRDFESAREPASATRARQLSIPAREPVPTASILDKVFAWRDALLASPRFQSWAARFPLSRPIAQRRSRALFDLMAGFVYSQVLQVCVELGIFELLSAAPRTLPELSRQLDLSSDATERIVRAAVSLRLLEWRTSGRVGLGALGAPLTRNRGLQALIGHHSLLYKDLMDPTALLRSRADRQTALGQYYPYAADGARPGEHEVAPYSALMSATAAPLIEEVLDAYRFDREARVLDVGGGEGRFARALSSRWPTLDVAVFDLPAVVQRAAAENERVGSKVRTIGGDFREDRLPGGWDVVSLVRILLDHPDNTVVELLRNVHQALNPNGKALIVEPMAGARGAGKVGDAYFGLYLLAMGKGRARRKGELIELCLAAGFRRCRTISTRYPVSAGILIAER